MKMRTTIATMLLLAAIGTSSGSEENPFVKEGLEKLRTTDTFVEVPVSKTKIAAVSEKLAELTTDPGASLTRTGAFKIAIHLADTFHGSAQTIHVEEIWQRFDLASRNINSFRITLLDQGWIDQKVRGQHYQYVVAPGEDGQFVLKSAKAWLIAWPGSIEEVRNLARQENWGAKPAPSRIATDVIPQLIKLGAKPTLAQVTAILGSPDKQVGSGIHIYTYRLSNSDTIRVGTSINPPDDIRYLSYIDHLQGKKETRLFALEDQAE